MARPRRFDTPLATQGKTIRLGPGKYTVEITRQGMTQAEIIKAFRRDGSAYGFNAKGLMRALLWEEVWACEDGKARPRKDVRGFLFYEVMGPTFVKVMQLTWTDSFDSTMGQVWAEALEADPNVPALLNVYSEKEGLYDIKAKVGNAYPNVLVAVEKADWFNELNVANIYGFSFCCTGGQKSSIAALEFLSELKRRGIDLSDGLTIFSMYDLDPAGWAIPENLRAFLQRYIRGEVKLVRLGLLPGAYDESGMTLRAKPYTSNAETIQAEKAANTT